MPVQGLEVAAGYAVLASALLWVGWIARDALQHWRWQGRQLRRVMAHHQQQAAEFARALRAQRPTDFEDWHGHRKFRVTRKVVESEQVASFYMTPHDGGALTAFLPGQHLTFRLHTEEGQMPLVRCYTLSALMTDDNEYRVSIKREDSPTPAQSSSCFFHDCVQADSILDVRPPAGDFTLDHAGARPVVFIAGGIGLTPFLAMGEYLEKYDPEREAWLFYGVRDRSWEVESERLREWAQRPNFHLVTCYSDPAEDDECDERGRIDIDVLRRHLPSSNYEFFLCAPPAMLHALRRALREWEVPAESIRFEGFKSATAREAMRDDPVFADLAPCKIAFRSAGKALDWTPESGTLLELATKEGVPLPSGCRVGNCGSCATPLMKGEFRYLKKPTFPVPKGSCLACLAVPVGDMEFA